ncbi:MAG: hypothetical protein OXU51_11510 [Candidatus Poribacteria bacterium]|nr:hypothetical protein [Candidatus Poribacteria bacterium]
MSFIPKIEKNVPEYISKRLEIYSERAEKMKGKTVRKVTVGFRERDDDMHESHVLKIEFEDGSILHIQTASNARNVIQDFEHDKKRKFKPSDFHVDMFFTWE